MTYVIALNCQNVFFQIPSYKEKRYKKNLTRPNFFFEYMSGFVMVVPQNLRFPFCWKYFFLKSQLFQTRLGFTMNRIWCNNQFSAFFDFFLRELNRRQRHLEIVLQGFLLSNVNGEVLMFSKVFFRLETWRQSYDILIWVISDQLNEKN